MLRIALVSMLCCLALAPAAYADHAQSMTFEAPVDLLDPATRPSTMDEISSLGAHQLRVILYWRNVAPRPSSRSVPHANLSDPASYDWGQYDALLAAAKERGWPVLLTVSGPVPKWATKKRRDYVTDPSARRFGQFMTAVGRHYGSQVDAWSIWNEPNHPDFLMPQYGKHHAPRSGTIYRGLFLAAWRALRATGNGRDTLLMGETAPIGTGHVVAPLTFLRQALCLNDRYQRRQGCPNLPATGYAHHAYTTAAGPFYRPPSPNAVTIGTLGRLENALDRAARTGAIRRHMPIYLTEFGIQSYPDRISGVRPGLQPQYYAISEKIAWDDRRVVSFSQYLMRDDARTGRGLGGFGGFESGLKYHNGRRKPAYDGFRLPLVVTRKAHGRVAIWGHVRPATGRTTAVVQVADGHGWRRLKTVRTDRRGYFHLRSSNGKGRTWRLTWKRYKGVRTQAFRAA